MKKYYDEYSTKEIDRALSHAFHERLDQEDYDILLSVCRFAKTNSFEEKLGEK